MSNPRERLKFIPFPLGELLTALKLDNFPLDTPITLKIIAVVSHFFPSGIPVSYDKINNPFIHSDIVLFLKRILSPIIARSASEQENILQFLDHFNYLVNVPSVEFSRKDEISKSKRQPNNTLDHEKKVKRAQLKKIQKVNKLIWLIMIFFILFLSVFIRNYVTDDTLKIYKNADTSLFQKEFYVESNKFYTPDSINWIFPDLAISTKDSTDKHISYLFKDTGTFIVKAYKYSTIQNPLSFILGKRNIVSKDSVFVWIEKDNSSLNGSKLIYRPHPQIMPDMQLYFYSSNVSIKKVVLIISLILTIIFILYVWNASGIKMKKLNDGPPLFIFLPEQDHLIRPENYLYNWAQMLNKRYEGERFIIDINKSIKSSINSAGLPSVLFKPILLKLTYLFLIDTRSAKSQQVRLCQYFIQFLEDNEVELAVFYFNNDPRMCWNEKFTKGIGLSELSALYRHARIVLFTDVENLIDYGKKNIHNWVTENFTSWEYRAIFTYKDKSTWGKVEKMVSEAFLVLPITPKGQMILADFFQISNLPSFEELLEDLFDENDFFENEIFQINPSFIENKFVYSYLVSTPNDKEKQLLFQWACATAICPEPAWEITLAIGKEIERAAQLGQLVTTNNLIKLTSLPWLHSLIIENKQRTELLKSLEPKYKEAAINAIERLFNDPVISTLPKDSVAYEQRHIRLAELKVHSNVKSKRKEGFQTLGAYVGSGLLKDEIITKLLKKKQKYRKLTFPIIFFICICLFTVLIPGKNISGIWLMNEKRIDSAAYYNNRAVSLFLGDVSFSNDSTYFSILQELRKSFHYRENFTAFYNLQVTKYNFGVALNSKEKRVFRDPIFSNEEIARLEEILMPFNLINMDSFHEPTVVQLKSYLEILYKHSLEDLQEFNSKYLGISQAVFDTITSKLLRKNILKPYTVQSWNSYNNTFDDIIFHPENNTKLNSKLDSLLNIYSFIALLYRNRLKEPTFTYPDRTLRERTGQTSPGNNIEVIRKERTLRAIMQMVDSTVLFGISFNSVMIREFGSNVNAPQYKDLPIATECDQNGSPRIRYYWRKISEAKDSSHYHNELGNIFYTDPSNNIIYFFRDNIFYRKELRVLLNTYQYQEILKKLKISSLMQRPNGGYFYRGTSFFCAVTPSSTYYAKIIIGTTESAFYCHDDWWYVEEK